MSDDFLFAEEPEPIIAVLNGSWKVLIVDDEPEVHAVTKLALSDFTFQSKNLSFLSAYSGSEAKALIKQHPDTAIILLDVVMETDDAGLLVARYIREELHNEHVRIILRTGQPGQAPERQVIINYDINDYKSKTELTAQKLFTVIMSSLRSYRDIMSLEQSRQGLEKIINASADLFSSHSMEQFIDGVLQQLTSILGCNEDALLVSSSLVAGNVAGEITDPHNLVVFAGQGEFESKEGKPVQEVLAPELMEAFDTALKSRGIVYRDNYLVAYCTSKFTHGSLLYISGLPGIITENQKKLIELFSQNVQIAYENVQLQHEIEDTQREIVYRLSEAVEHRSIETGNHVKRVAFICYDLAKAYGLPEEEAERLMFAAPLHDVGKVGIPDGILNKPAKLQGQEWEVMKTHTSIGYEILKNSKRSIIQAGAVIAQDHHEKWDGTGYPAGKKGEDIHIYGRIAALADVYDALRHRRCYKSAWPLDQVMATIEAEAGKQFDPKLVEIFKSRVDKLEAILQKYPDSNE
ncbi:Response regulator receiver domain-containing protein [Rheinheimera pacifica]|uniref:Response regulator receiver domain-containing protein n=1 Tax=Rheinheimera pacifica TaxID=173990 RepID=A0A1H6N980_9GAMM|nr:response regulator [Rheinheimera pacifica]SEI07002.1 Response regulator receiver domain-containing protein [Rheinheimera pacifica]